MDRQQLILERAHKIIQDKKIPTPYIHKLRWIIQHKKLIYTANATRTAGDENGKQVTAIFYGTSNIATGKIRLTAAIWNRFSGQKLLTRLDYDIVHELRHIMTRSHKHLPNLTTFDSIIKSWGYSK